MKRFAACLIALLMLFSMTAMAEENWLSFGDYDLYTGYYNNSGEEASSSSYAFYYNAEAGKLTLNNASISLTDTSIAHWGNLELNLVGTSTITVDGDYGTFYVYGDLTVTGSGSLEINADGTPLMVCGNLTMNSGNLTANCNSNTSDEIGLVAVYIDYEDGPNNVEILGGTLKANAGNGGVSAIGLFVTDGDVLVNGGTLVCTSGTAVNSSAAAILGDLTVKSGSISGTSKGSTDMEEGFSEGIYCEVLTVEGGTVTGNAGKGAWSTGISSVDSSVLSASSRSAAGSSINMSGGSMTGNAANATIQSTGIMGNTITMTGGNMTGNAGSAENSCGIETYSITMDDGIMTGNSTSGIGINYTSANLSGELVEREPDSDTDQIRPANSSSTGDASQPILWAMMMAFACVALMLSKKRAHA